MRVKIAVLLSFVGVLGAMEPEKPIKKLVRSNKMKKLRRSGPGQVAAPAVAPEAPYVTDAKDFITHIPSFGDEYSEKELVKAFTYYADKNPTNYGIFLARVRNLKNGSPDVTSCDEDALIIQALKIMHRFRYDNAHEHKAAKQELAATHADLEAQHATLQGAHEEQITKTKYANWRSYGAGIGGAAATFVTGFLTWYLRQPTCPVCAMVNATARLI